MGVAYGVETVPTKAFAKNTVETSGSSLVQRQKDTSMATNPRENSWGGRISKETSGRLAYVGEISPRIASVRSNTGETSDSSLLQRKRETLMATNPRENSWGGRISRETSRRLAYVGNISPRIASVRSNTGETSGSSSLQRQRETSMAPNPRENSWGGRISRETSGRLAYVEEMSPRIASVRSNTEETSGSSSLHRQRETSMAPNPRENSWGGAFPERPLEGWRMWERSPQE